MVVWTMLIHVHWLEVWCDIHTTSQPLAHVIVWTMLIHWLEVLCNMNINEVQFLSADASYKPVITQLTGIKQYSHLFGLFGEGPLDNLGGVGGGRSSLLVTDENSEEGAGEFGDKRMISGSLKRRSLIGATVK